MEDAKTAHVEAGEAVEYRPTASRDLGPGAGVAVPTYAMSVTRDQVPVEADGRRTVRHALMVSVPKADVPTVSQGGDRIELPGAWVGSDEETVVWRVAEVMKDRSSPGSWVLGMAK